MANQCEESFTLDQAGVANMGFSNNFTTIHAGAHANISTLFSVHDTFFVNGKGLRPDWKEAWEALQTKLTPLIEKRVVVGYFVGDELFPGKISYADFLTCIRALAEAKKKYPWFVTWENEGGTGWVSNFKQTGVPPELDIISLDDYYMGDSPKSEASGHRKFYEDSIYPLLHPHQKVFLVPGAFATHERSHNPPGPPPAPAEPLPPANSTGCAKCPASHAYGYGNADAGGFCCSVPTTGDNQHCPGELCCLTPGSKEGCQNAKRCGSNPTNATACVQDPAKEHGGGSNRYAKGNATYCYGGTFDGCDEYMAEQALAFAAWAAEDDRVAGFAPWHWDSRDPSCCSPYKEVGVADMPKTKAAWKQIGDQARLNAAAGATLK